MIEILLPTARWDAPLRGLLGHLDWMSREYDLLVTVSDNSQDAGKRAFLEKLTAANPRLRVLVQAQRLSMFRNFAALLRAAERPYAVLLGDDDWMAPSYVLGADALLEAQPQTAAVMGTFLQVVPGERAVLQPALNVSAAEPAQRIRQYLAKDDGFNYPLYSVFRTAAARPFADYVEKHPLPASFFDNLIVYSLLARGGLVSRNSGPYVYQNTNWSSLADQQKSNQRAFMQLGLPEWFGNFQALYFAVEGAAFLGEAAGEAVFQHHLGRFRRRLAKASPQWWQKAGQQGFREPVEALNQAGEMKLEKVRDSFLALLRSASPAVHERYLEFHERMQRS